MLRINNLFVLGLACVPIMAGSFAVSSQEAEFKLPLVAAYLAGTRAPLSSAKFSRTAIFVASLLSPSILTLTHYDDGKVAERRGSLHSTPLIAYLL